METYNKPTKLAARLKTRLCCQQPTCEIWFFTQQHLMLLSCLCQHHTGTPNNTKSLHSLTAASLNRIIRTSGLIFIFMLTSFSILLWVQTKFPDWEKGLGCCTDGCIQREKRLQSQTLTSKSQSHHLFFFFHPCRHTEKSVSLKLW